LTKHESVLKGVISALERRGWKGKDRPPGSCTIYRVKKDGQPAKLVVVPKEGEA